MKNLMQTMKSSCQKSFIDTTFLKSNLLSEAVDWAVCEIRWQVFAPTTKVCFQPFTLVQLPDCGHSFGVQHLDDGLAAVGTKPDIHVSRASRIQSDE
jgi:hypothetical protein